jgi:hypothetical protein
MIMANARKYAGNTYYKLEELHDKPPVRERISLVAEEDGKYGKRLVATFESGKKLSLNATSVGNLIRDLGGETDEWNDHDVKVYAGEVAFQNGRADCILVEAIDVDKPIESRKALVERSPAKPVDAQSGGGGRHVMQPLSASPTTRQEHWGHGSGRWLYQHAHVRRQQRQ